MAPDGAKMLAITYAITYIANLFMANLNKRPEAFS